MKPQPNDPLEIRARDYGLCLDAAEHYAQTRHGRNADANLLADRNTAIAKIFNFTTEALSVGDWFAISEDVDLASLTDPDHVRWKAGQVRLQAIRAQINPTRPEYQTTLGRIGCALTPAPYRKYFWGAFAGIVRTEVNMIAPHHRFAFLPRQSTQLESTDSHSAPCEIISVRDWSEATIGSPTVQPAIVRIGKGNAPAGGKAQLEDQRAQLGAEYTLYDPISYKIGNQFYTYSQLNCWPFRQFRNPADFPEHYIGCVTPGIYRFSYHLQIRANEACETRIRFKLRSACYPTTADTTIEEWYVYHPKRATLALGSNDPLDDRWFEIQYPLKYGQCPVIELHCTKLYVSNEWPALMFADVDLLLLHPLAYQDPGCLVPPAT